MFRVWAIRNIPLAFPPRPVAQNLAASRSGGSTHYPRSAVPTSPPAAGCGEVPEQERAPEQEQDSGHSIGAEECCGDREAGGSLARLSSRHSTDSRGGGSRLPPGRLYGGLVIAGCARGGPRLWGPQLSPGCSWPQPDHLAPCPPGSTCRKQGGSKRRGSCKLTHPGAALPGARGPGAQGGWWVGLPSSTLRGQGASYRLLERSQRMEPRCPRACQFSNTPGLASCFLPRSLSPGPFLQLTAQKKPPVHKSSSQTAFGKEKTIWTKTVRI